MQPTESFNQPRRTPDVEDYIDILRRHKSWIFGPFLLVLVATVVGVFLYPNSYSSRAVVSIKPPQISTQIAKAAVNIDIADRINQLSQQVLSRGELSNMVRNLNLYKSEQNSMPFEDVLELMRKNIHLSASAPIVGGRNVPAFEVSFSYRNRFDATKVVDSLVSKFIDENIKNRDRSTYQQEDFVKNLAEQAKKRLDEADAKLTEFRLSHQGTLPDQMNSNLTQMGAVQTNLMSLTNAVSRASSEKMQLETAIRNYKDQIAGLERDSKAVVSQGRSKSAKLVAAENQLEQLQVVMIAARKRLTEAHPDVRNLKGQIETIQQQVDRIQAEEAVKPTETAAAPVVNIALEREIRNYNASILEREAQVQAKVLEIAGYERQAKSASDQLTMLNARISGMPQGDQVFNDLLREQMLAKEEYISQSQHLTQAQVMVEMEGRKQGETLEILDSASLAVEPTDPNRPLVISVGAGLGLLVGIVMASAREMKDTSLKNLKDVRAYTHMPILGSVPLLENDFVVRRRRRIAWLGWTIACLTAALVMAGSIVYYFATTKAN